MQYRHLSYVYKRTRGQVAIVEIQSMCVNITQTVTDLSKTLPGDSGQPFTLN